MKPWESGEVWYVWHPPKTAGTTVWKNLSLINDRMGKYWYRQSDARTLLRETEKDRTYVDVIESDMSWSKHIPIQKTTVPRNCTSIITVRDPYPRCLSMWSYYIKHVQKRKKLGLWQDNATFMFDDFMDHYVYRRSGPPMGRAWAPWRPCVYWYKHLKGPVHAIRQESIGKDFKRLTGYEMAEYPEGNYTMGWDRESALTFLSQYQIEKINEWFAEDFEVFGYEKV